MNGKLPHFVFVSPYRHGDGMSGAWRRTTELCKALQSEGLARVTVLSPRPINKSIEHIPFNAEGGLILRVFKYIQLLYLLRNFRNAHIVSEFPIAPVPLRGNKILHLIHDAKFATDLGRRGKTLASFIHKCSSRICDYVLTVSAPEKIKISSALKIEPKKIVVSKNGLSKQWFYKISYNEPEFDLIYVSNFAPHKNHLSLLKACVDSDWRIAFVGSGIGTGESTFNECIEFVNNYNLRCTFFSNLSDSELIDIYDSSRVFAFPSKLEGFGIPFIEARCRGLPVIANDIDIFRELARSLRGTIVDFKQPSEVKKKIEQNLQIGKDIPDTIADYRWETIAIDLINAVSRTDKTSAKGSFVGTT